MQIVNFIDIKRYPINNANTAKYSALLTQTRAMLKKDGCAVLPNFINTQGVSALKQEADEVAPAAWRSFNQTNIYFSKDDESLPISHPRRRFYKRANAFVPADNFGANSPLRNLYEYPPLTKFIQNALQEHDFYRYADPLADVIINIVEPRAPDDADGFPWHFDTNSYTVTLAIQNAEDGGVFEYAPALRGTNDENYSGAQKILDGNTRAVTQLHLHPGDLQIFRGRHALHRVTAITGNRPRYVAIFSFANIPDMVASPERCKQLYGRVLPIHLQKSRARSDTLID